MLRWRHILSWDVASSDMIFEDEVGDVHHYNFNDMTYWIEESEDVATAANPSQLQRRGPGDWYFLHPGIVSAGWGNDFLDMSTDDLEAVYQRWLRGEE